MASKAIAFVDISVVGHTYSCCREQGLGLCPLLLKAQTSRSTGVVTTGGARYKQLCQTRKAGSPYASFR